MAKTKKKQLTEYQTELLNKIKQTVEVTEGRSILATVTHVAKSGVSRYIKFALLDTDGTFTDITETVAAVLENTYNREKGVHVKGCGSDMIFMSLYYTYRKIGVQKPETLASHYRYF